MAHQETDNNRQRRLQCPCSSDLTATLRYKLIYHNFHSGGHWSWVHSLKVIWLVELPIVRLAYYSYLLYQSTLMESQNFDEHKQTRLQVGGKSGKREHGDSVAAVSHVAKKRGGAINWCRPRTHANVKFDPIPRAAVPIKRFEPQYENDVEISTCSSLQSCNMRKM